MVPSSAFRHRLSLLRTDPRVIGVTHGRVATMLKKLTERDAKFVAKANPKEQLAERLGFFTIPAYGGYRLLSGPKRHNQSRTPASIPTYARY